MSEKIMNVGEVNAGFGLRIELQKTKIAEKGQEEAVADTFMICEEPIFKLIYKAHDYVDVDVIAGPKICQLENKGPDESDTKAAGLLLNPSVRILPLAKELEGAFAEAFTFGVGLRYTLLKYSGTGKHLGRPSLFGFDMSSLPINHALGLSGTICSGWDIGGGILLNVCGGISYDWNNIQNEVTYYDDSKLSAGNIVQKSAVAGTIEFNLTW